MQKKELDKKYLWLFNKLPEGRDISIFDFPGVRVETINKRMIMYV
jgi:hypothetical protein